MGSCERPGATRLACVSDELERKPKRDDEELQRRRLVTLLRVIVAILLAVVLSLGIVTESTTSETGIQMGKWWWVAVLGTLLFFGIVIAIDVLTPKRKLSTISAILFGTFAGLLATAVLWFVIDYFRETFRLMISNEQITTAKVILGLGLCYLGASTVLQTQDDFRLVIPYVEFAKQLRGPKPLILDTSALIDGRILDVAEVGLLQSPLLVPRFVIGELQQLSDSSDKLKRARGRRGLDIVTKLQKSPRLDVTIDETPIPGMDVDAMLVELARLVPGVIVTTDSGLSRVAGIQGVTVLNMHDLANAMKPNVIPGEPLTVALLKKGEQVGQAVGYLEDGTMVVAENGERMIGREVTLTVTSTMQTSAGRLIFGRVAEDPNDGSGEHRSARAPGGTDADSGDDAAGESGGPLGPPRPAGIKRSLRNPRRGT